MSNMRTGYKCRAYPTPAQAAVFGRTFGGVRLVWNKTLADRNTAYRQRGERTSYRQTDAALTAWKKTVELAFLSEVSSVPLQQTLRHQHTAFANFFAGRARYPRSKSRTGRQSAHYTRSAFRIKDGRLYITRTDGPLQVIWSWPYQELTRLVPTLVIVSRESDGRWYVTFAVDIDTPTPLAPAGRAIGVDLGVKDFAVISDGDRIANPRHLDRKARNLARYQRRLARCQKGSHNRRKAKAKVARPYRKVRNARVWTCPACRTRHDRGLNAAKNILAAGRAVAGGDPSDACGADVRRQGFSLPRSAMKQETQRATAGLPSLKEG